jgi:hypothetical protein
MMGILPFGMVTILLLTLVSFKTYPARIWSSKTIAPESTWYGKNNKLSQGIWKPAYHVGTFLGKKGAMLLKRQKSQEVKFTQIDSSLNGRVLNSTTTPQTILLLQNNGNLKQTTNGTESIIYSSQTAPLWAPIKLVYGGNTRCATAEGSNNARITFSPCGIPSRQHWRLAQDGSVLNRGWNSCLDIGADNIPKSNTCNPNKATQKWSWKNGYLRNETGGKRKCLKTKSTWGDHWSSKISDCTGLKMSWNS